MNKWDETHINNFEVFSNKMKFVPAKDGHEWHFELDLKNLYFDELAFMIEYLEAIGELRFKANTGTPREKLF